MANKLIFKYGVMNVGKSNDILSTFENYKNANINVLLAKPSLDTRTKSTVKSRSGWEKKCYTIERNDNLKYFNNFDVILIDEAQFLSKKQVDKIRKIVDLKEKHIICFGLKVNFKGKLFKASKKLIESSDKLIEMSGMCSCGKKATMILKTINGEPVIKGETIDIGLEDKYTSLCHKCWFTKTNKQK